MDESLAKAAQQTIQSHTDSMVHQYRTKSGKYIFYTDEPLTPVEIDFIEANEELVAQQMKTMPGALKVQL